MLLNVILKAAVHSSSSLFLFKICNCSYSRNY